MEAAGSGRVARRSVDVALHAEESADTFMSIAAVYSATESKSPGGGAPARSVGSSTSCNSISVV